MNTMTAARLVQPPLRFLDAPLALPLVSFVVTNHNYGRFVERCVDSILAQTYPNVECIVVDDKSTDGSVETIRDLCTRRPGQVAAVLNPVNLGQTRACIEGFKVSRGAYVAFIDADDTLDPDYAAAHLWTHFTSRNAIGFTSCDLMTAVDGRIVLPTVLDKHLTETFTVHVARKTLRSLPSDVEALFEDLPRFKVREASPTTTFWVWAPTSGNVYRRDVLDLFMDNDRIGKLKNATDAYLNFAINALCGSKIIDRAFGVYHVHGGNAFAKTAPLAGMKSFESKDDFGCFAAYCAMEHIVLNFRRFALRAYDLRQMHRALTTLLAKSRQSTWLIDVSEAVAIRIMGLLWRRRLKGFVPRRK